jgi:hypothetical protein
MAGRVGWQGEAPAITGNLQRGAGGETTGRRRRQATDKARYSLSGHRGNGVCGTARGSRTDGGRHEMRDGASSYRAGTGPGIRRRAPSGAGPAVPGERGALVRPRRSRRGQLARRSGWWTDERGPGPTGRPSTPASDPVPSGTRRYAAEREVSSSPLAGRWPGSARSADGTVGVMSTTTSPSDPAAPPTVMPPPGRAAATRRRPGTTAVADTSVSLCGSPRAADRPAAGHFGSSSAVPQRATVMTMSTSRGERHRRRC